MNVNKGGQPHGGLEALVAAATAANQKNERSKRKKGEVTTPSTTDTVQALATILQNPVFAQALANAQGAATPPNGASQPNHGVENQNLGGMGVGSYNLNGNGDGSGIHDTPYQQTRSGRISRPPVQPVQTFPYPFFQDANASLQVPNAFPAGANGYNGLDVNGNNGLWQGMTLAGVPQMSMANGGSNVGGDGGGNEGGSGGAAPNLPAWPLPPSGPGGRKKMGKEELLARRRARNKESGKLRASQHRKKSKAKVDQAETKLREKEAAYDILEAHCQALEKQVQQLQSVILSAGMSLPTPLPTPAPVPTNQSLPNTDPTSSGPSSAPPLDLDSLAAFDFSQLGSASQMAGGSSSSTAPPQQMINHASVGSSNMDMTLAPFDMFSYLDMDGEDDAEFIPPTSPQRDSDLDLDDDGRPRTGSKQKGKKRKGTGGEDEEDDDEFIDEDVEDEDLFLPIEDVPVPPARQMESAMRSLGVDNQEELARLINKMVTAGKEGMTSEMVDKLKVLLSLVGPNGTWSKE